MICVSIGRGRHKHMIAEHRFLVEQGIELCELRLDYITGPVKLKRLLDNRPGPVIVTCRRERDGGRWSGDETERQMMLRTAVVEGADYVDIEEDVAENIPRYGKTKRIISYHNFRETPADLASIHARMAKHDPDIVKLATMANSPADNVRMLQLVESSEIPTVGLCMGEMGMPSRLLGGRFGVPFTFATTSNERSIAPGQIGFKPMRELFRYEQITRQTRLYGVAADPVGHSLSPQLHNAGFIDRGLDACYIPFRVPRQHLANFLQEVCPTLGIQGLSVTIPHKETAVPLLARQDEVVQGIGATNTIVFEEAGPAGFNTDSQAAMESLESVLGGEASLAGKEVLVLGSGGVSRAIAWTLKQRGADVVVSGRSPDKVEALAENLKCRHVPWNERGEVVPQILVNGTPVGMHPNVNETPFHRDWLRSSMVVFDTVYNPEQTLLIKEAREKQARVVTGVEMFVRQAALQFHRFTGEEISHQLLRDELKRITAAVRPS